MISLPTLVVFIHIWLLMHWGVIVTGHPSMQLDTIWRRGNHVWRILALHLHVRLRMLAVMELFSGRLHVEKLTQAAIVAVHERVRRRMFRLLLQMSHTKVHHRRSILHWSIYGHVDIDIVLIGSPILSHTLESLKVELEITKLEEVGELFVWSSDHRRPSRGRALVHYVCVVGISIRNAVETVPVKASLVQSR